jgi:hypothetical protein
MGAEIVNLAQWRAAHPPLPPIPPTPAPMSWWERIPGMLVLISIFLPWTVLILLWLHFRRHH